MERKAPEILKVSTTAKSRLFEIESVHLKFSNGVNNIYERLAVESSTDAVIIVPMLDDQNLILVKEYAVGIEKYQVALPTGLIEKNEEIHEAANRELMEEIGYGADVMHTLHTLYLAPSFTGFKAHVVLATELYDKKLEADEPEPPEKVIWPLKRLDDILSTREVSDSYSLAALYLVRDYIDKCTN